MGEASGGGVPPWKLYPGGRNFRDVVNNNQNNNQNQNQQQTQVVGNRLVMPPDRAQLVKNIMSKFTGEGVFPPYFHPDMLQAKDIDFLIFDAIPPGVPAEAFGDFCAFFMEKFCESLSPDELDLLYGGSWLPGNQSYGAPKCTWRLHLKRDQVLHQRCLALFTKLMNGFKLQVTGISDPMIVKTRGVTLTDSSQLILRFSRLPRDALRMGFCRDVVQQILKKYNGFEQVSVETEFILWNREWDRRTGHLLPDTTSLYVIVNGVQEGHELAGKYLQVSVGKKTTFNIAPMQPAYSRFLSQIFDERKTQPISREPKLFTIFKRLEEETEKAKSDLLTSIFDNVINNPANAMQIDKNINENQDTNPNANTNMVTDQDIIVLDTDFDRPIPQQQRDADIENDPEMPPLEEVPMGTPEIQMSPVPQILQITLTGEKRKPSESPTPTSPSGPSKKNELNFRNYSQDLQLEMVDFLEFLKGKNILNKLDQSKQEQLLEVIRVHNNSKKQFAACKRFLIKEKIMGDLDFQNLYNNFKN